MADLKDYVSSVLIDICEGVNAAAARIEEMGGSVNPRFISSAIHKDPASGRKIVDVTFEVALEVTSTTTNVGQAGVNALTIKLGTTREGQDGERAANSVSFVVPVTLPVSQDTLNAERQRAEEQRQDQIRQHGG